jgi:hypothetical protein
VSETTERTTPSVRDTKGKGKDVSTRYSDLVDDLQDVLDGIPDRPGKSLMTFEELQARIGAAPKKDRFRGLKKMSTRYKAIGQKLAQAKATLANATVGQIADEGGRDVFERSLNDRLDEIDAACARYQKKHTGKKGRAVQGLRDDVARFRKEIAPALDALTSGTGGGLPEEMPLDQAMAAYRAGIKPGQLKGVSARHCDFAKFNDEKSDGPAKHLDKGNVSSVHLVSFGGVERVFKKEQQSDTSGANAPMFMGIDVANDPRYGNRNVAGGLVGKLLGTGVMPECSFGISGGEVGLMMEKAPGKTLRQMLRDKDLKPGSLSPKALASLQRQLMDLEACDILTGQTDRHPGNYMIDIRGDNVTVTGIDNDFSFPNPTGAISDKIPPRFLGMNSIPNLPVLMSKEVAERIKAIDFDRDMAPRMRGLLNDDEIAGTKTRLETLQAHVAKLEKQGCIVANWETWRAPPPNQKLTATEFLYVDPEDEDDGGDSNLFGRDFGKALGLT